MIQRADRGKAVREVQEWLWLQGYPLAIDGIFGPATERAVKEFQKASSLRADSPLPMTGKVDAATLDRLTRPLRTACGTGPDSVSLAQAAKTLSAAVVIIAHRHLSQHPREVGGENCGPWVRLYTGGREGPAWPWCAAFVSFALKQACDTLGVPLPIPRTFSCDLLAAYAKQRKRFLASPSPAERKRITPGSLFLVRRAPGDWTHTGIVVSAEAEHFMTIEGNTNDSGSREGYEVCKRTRGYGGKDFILI